MDLDYLSVGRKHSTREAYTLGCTVFVSCYDPDPYASFLEICDALFDILLEHVFHTRGSKQHQVTFEVAISLICDFNVCANLFVGKYQSSHALLRKFFDMLTRIFERGTILVRNLGQDSCLSSFREDKQLAIRVGNHNRHHAALRCKFDGLNYFILLLFFAFFHYERFLCFVDQGADLRLLCYVKE